MKIYKGKWQVACRGEPALVTVHDGSTFVLTAERGHYVLREQGNPSVIARSLSKGVLYRQFASWLSAGE